MTTWGAASVVLDPAEVAVARTALDINNGPIRVSQSGIDWGDAAIQAYLADQQYGSSPVDFRIPNRIVTIPLGLGMDESAGFRAAGQSLRQKVGLIQREGGWLKRTNTNGTKMYADVVNATLHLPDMTGDSGGASGVEDNVTLTLECLPDFYGDEVTLDAITGSVDHVLAVLQKTGAQAAIAGDHPARCRIQVTATGAPFTVTIASPGVFTATSPHGLAPGDAIVFSTTGALPTGLTAGTIYYVLSAGFTGTAFEVSTVPSGTAVNTSGSQSGVHSYAKNQQGMLWAYRSRHYDSATTAKLFYEGEAMTPLDAAATFAHAGFSGGSTLRHNSLPAGSWCPVLLTDLLAGGSLTHQGTYSVRARVYSATATPQLRLLWGIGDVAHPVVNDLVKLPLAGTPFVVDLGQVRLDAPPVGTFKWKGVIQALAASQNDPIEIDCLYLVPIDESAGIVQAVQAPSSLGIIAAKNAGAGADNASAGAVAWTGAGNITVEDGTPANVAVPSTNSHYLVASTFGFAIPTGATISGIQVDVKKQGINNLGAVNVVDTAVRLTKDVTGVLTIQATDKSDTITPWPSPLFAFKTYGGPTDLWGGTWAPADINNNNFGFAIRCQGGASNQQGAIDVIKITVSYVTAGGFATQQDAVVYATRQAELRTEGMYRQDATGQVEGQIGLTIGDLPRLPPSGLEGRAVELLLKPSRGDLATVTDGVVTDTFTAQVFYRPTYLFLP